MPEIGTTEEHAWDASVDVGVRGNKPPPSPSLRHIHPTCGTRQKSHVPAREAIPSLSASPETVLSNTELRDINIARDFLGDVLDSVTFFFPRAAP
jgi:hypothetical protein